MARNAEKSGADAILIFSPPGGPQTIEGQERYFKDIANSVNIGVFVYPRRTQKNYWPTLIQRLVTQPNILGFKDGTGGIYFEGPGNPSIDTLDLQAQTIIGVAEDQSASIVRPLQIPIRTDGSAGLKLAGAGTLIIEGSLDVDGRLELDSDSSMTLDVRGDLNLAADIDLLGGNLYTGIYTVINLEKSITLKTGSDQLIGQFVPAGPGLSLTLGDPQTKLLVATSMIVNTPSWPIQPMSQTDLLGGVRLDSNGVMEISDWLAGDIELNGGLLKIAGNVTIPNPVDPNNEADILLIDSSGIEITEDSKLKYGGSAISMSGTVLSLTGSGILENTNSLLLQDSGSELTVSYTHLTLPPSDLV